MSAESGPARAKDRLTTVLLVLCAVFFSATILLGGYLYFQFRDIQDIKATQLARAELERQTLAQSDAERALFPPVHSEIGYLLNPFMKNGEASFFTPGKSFPVNKLGLRGKPIKAKVPGVKRILLVGDSMFYGWKLGEEDRLEAVLGELLDEKLGQHPYEVLTLALPGWNLEAEARSLEAYQSLLQPDLLVWAVIRNDVNYTPGVAANDILATHYTRQGGGEVVRRGMSWTVSDILMPAVRERWVQALGALRRVQARFGVPLVIYNMNLDNDRFAKLLEENKLDVPVVHRPPEVIEDRSLWIEERDKHPSRAGNRVLAVTILDALAQAGLIEGLTFTPEEQAILARYAPYQETDLSVESLAAGMAEAAQNIPSSYRPGEKRWWGHLYGAATGQWQVVLQDGVIYIRLQPGQRKIRGQFGLSNHLTDYPRTLELTFRGENGAAIREVVPIEGFDAEFTVDVDSLRGSHGLIEMTWHFDFSECTAPHVCFSGALVSLDAVP